MEIIRNNKNSKDAFSEGILKTVKIKTGAVEIINLEISPGNALKPHDMPSKVIFYVTDGVGEFTYGDITETLTVGDMVHVNPGKPRFWANNSDRILSLLVIKSLSEK